MRQLGLYEARPAGPPPPGAGMSFDYYMGADAPPVASSRNVVHGLAQGDGVGDRPQDHQKEDSATAEPRWALFARSEGLWSYRNQPDKE